MPVAQLKTVSDMYAVNIVDTAHKVRSGALDWSAGSKAVSEALLTIETEWLAYEATKLTQAEKALAEAFDTARAASSAAIAALQDIMQRRDRSAFERFIDDQLYAVIDPLALRINELIQLQLSEANLELVAAKEEKEQLVLSKAIIAGFALATLVATVWFVMAGVFRPLTRLREAMRQLAAGNLGLSIFGEGRRDEIGQMAGAIAIFRDNALERQRLEEAAAATRSLSERERQEREAQKALEAAEVQSAVSALAYGLDKLAEGDLTYRIDTVLAAHLDQLRSNFNSSVGNLEDALRSVGETARGISAGATEIRSAAADLSRRTEQQAASVEETAAALDQILGHSFGCQQAGGRSRLVGGPHPQCCGTLRRDRRHRHRCDERY